MRGVQHRGTEHHEASTPSFWARVSPCGAAASLSRSLSPSAAVSRCCLACTKAAEPRSGACRICAPWRRGPTVRPRPLLPWCLLGPLRRGVAAGLRATSLRPHTARMPFPAVEASSAHAALSPHSPPSAALAPTHAQLVQHTAPVLHSSPFGAGATRRPASAGRILDLALSRVASTALSPSRCGLKAPRCRSRATATWACVARALSLRRGSVAQLRP